MTATVELVPMTREHVDQLMPYEREMFGPEAWSRAAYRAELGETDAAFEDVQRALDLAPANALYHVTHAELLAADDRNDEALTALETALRHDPDATPLLDTEAFDGLRKHPRFTALLRR